MAAARLQACGYGGGEGVISAASPCRSSRAHHAGRDGIVAQLRPPGGGGGDHRGDINRNGRLAC
jgi:hypothetical protein